MSTAPAPTVMPITFHVQQGKNVLQIEATSLVELLDGTRLTKKELVKGWGINERTYDKRRIQPDTMTFGEAQALAKLLHVPLLDLARLVVEQNESTSADHTTT